MALQTQKTFQDLPARFYSITDTVPEIIVTHQYHYSAHCLHGDDELSFSDWSDGDGVNEGVDN